MIDLIKSTFYKEKQVKKKLSEFILNSNKLSMDKNCFSFENKFSKKQERKHSVMVNSGSKANLCLIQSLLNVGYIKK